MANYTTNYNLKKPLGTENYNVEDQNSNMDIIDIKLKEIDDKASNISVPVTSVNSKTGAVVLSASDIKTSSGNTLETSLSDNVYQTAGGTATAITLTINGTLINGYPMTFIASANNNGTSTTINNKKLYKPNTTTAPNLIAGKAYTVWYSATGDSGNGCFFIKASAEGNASVENVLAGKTFSNDYDTGLVGTIQKYIGVNQLGTQASQGSQKIIYITPPKGYFEASQVYIQDNNYVPENILSGKSIFGLQGTANLKKFAGGSDGENINYVTITGLDFKPSIIELRYFNSSMQLMTGVWTNTNYGYYWSINTSANGKFSMNVTSNGFSFQKSEILCPLAEFVFWKAWE